MIMRMRLMTEAVRHRLLKEETETQLGVKSKQQ